MSIARRLLYAECADEASDQYFFYNVVEQGTTQAYGRPSGANDEAKWAKAMRENPDPTW